MDISPIVNDATLSTRFKLEISIFVFGDFNESPIVITNFSELDLCSLL